ncbi:MAG: hypothetical protein B7Z82_08540 [Halothiobacillus sp. 20-54-6]|nr:MAG: hypothetical protein B7Z82_08540 [Halothiobacillus sp. 20-54-6]
MIGRDGKLIVSFDSPVTPEARRPRIEVALRLGSSSLSLTKKIRQTTVFPRQQKTRHEAGFYFK